MAWPRLQNPLLLLAAVMLPCVLSAAPTTKPTTAPARPTDARIDGTATLGHCTVATLADQIRHLDSPDQDSRQRTRELLMSLSPDELPLLRDAVKSVVPLSPVQLTLLRDVVCQIAAEPQEDVEDQAPNRPDAVIPVGPVRRTAPIAQPTACLGVTLTGDGEGGSSEPNIGAVVEQRILGYVGYRMLRDGDVIDSIQVPGSDAVKLPDLIALQNAVLLLSPGTVVTLGVERAGRHLLISLALDARGADLRRAAEASVVANLIEQQIEKGNAYWSQQFAPVVGQADPSAPMSAAE